MKFTKMQALGNDYICIDCFQEEVRDHSALAVELCKRRFSIGADGMLFVSPSDKVDCHMDIYNADGSQAKMCGNGIRCVGKYLYEHGISRNPILSVETSSGIYQLILNIEDDQVREIRVDMGCPNLNARSIPILCEKEIVFHEPIQVGEEEYLINGISMGNPHVVTFVPEVDKIPLEKIGIPFEFHQRFPNRMNIEFCEIIGVDRIKVRVWERGVGETLACGTGACASVVAAVLNHLTERKVSVELKGGVLGVEWKKNNNHVYLTGSATEVYEGTINYV